MNVVRDVYVILLDGTILDVNDAAVESYGYTREELLKMNISDLRTPEEGVKLTKVLERSRHGCKLDTVHRRKDGSTFPIAIRSRGIVIDGKKVLVGMGRDITERKRAEEALRESDEKFRTLADNIPNLVWMANPDGGIFWYNKQWYDYTGTTLEEMQGWGWQKVHHPDYVKAVTEEWSSSIKDSRAL